MLKLSAIDVFYGDIQALWGVSLEVKQGEVLALVGSNGAGKSTTLRAISGLLKPRAGTIEFDDQRIEQLSPHKIVELGIAHVPEGRRVFPLMTVSENLDMGSHPTLARKERKANKEYVYTLFPRLKEREHQLAGTLSGGEQQMLAVGRGLMLRPKILILDEPSLGLAPLLVQEIFRTIQQIKQEGVTILLVEQNVRHTLSMADRGYVLENGRIVLAGSGRELLENNHVKKAYLGM